MSEEKDGKTLEESIEESIAAILRCQKSIQAIRSRLKGNDDDNAAEVLARKKPPKYPFGPSTAKARPEAE